MIITVVSSPVSLLFFSLPTSSLSPSFSCFQNNPINQILSLLQNHPMAPISLRIAKVPMVALGTLHDWAHIASLTSSPTALSVLYPRLLRGLPVPWTHQARSCVKAFIFALPLSGIYFPWCLHGSLSQRKRMSSSFNILIYSGTFRCGGSSWEMDITVWNSRESSGLETQVL